MTRGRYCIFFLHAEKLTNNLKLSTTSHACEGSGGDDSFLIVGYGKIRFMSPAESLLSGDNGLGGQPLKGKRPWSKPLRCLKITLCSIPNPLMQVQTDSVESCASRCDSICVE